MTKRNKIALTAGAAVVLAGLAYVLFGGSKPEQSIILETATVEKATIGNSVTATGTIEPVTEVEVGTQVSGIIRKIYVDYNSVVHKGQIIAELDKTNLTSEYNSAKSNLASAKSELDYQKANYKRMTTLHEKGFISDDEFESARLTYQKAQNMYNTQQENVRKAQTNLGYATITSPIDGTVLSKDVEEGQTVAASFNTPTLFTIAQDLTDMRVIADVDEADIGEVREGQRVTFTVDAFPTDTFEGEVTQVRQKGTTESNVVTYEVVISAPNEDLKLKPELTANVTIYTLERENIVSIPSKALRFTPTPELVGKDVRIIDCTGKNKLWTREGKTFKAHAVTLGITNGTRTEITGGIALGTEIVVDTKAETSPDLENTATEKSPFAPGPRKKNNKK